MTALHERYPFGYSLFDLFDRYSALPGGPVKLFFSGDDLSKLIKFKVSQWNDIVAELEVIGQLCGRIADHPLKEVQTLQYSQQVKVDAATLLQALLRQLDQYQEAFTKVSDALRWEYPVETRAQAVMLDDLTRLLLNLPDVPAGLFGLSHAEQSLARIHNLAEHGLKRDALRKSILETFTGAIFDLDAKEMLTEWHTEAEKWFLPKFLKQQAVAKVLKKTAHSRRIDKVAVPGYLESLNAWQEEQAVLDKATDLPERLDFLWNNGDCD